MVRHTWQAALLVLLPGSTSLAATVPPCLDSQCPPPSEAVSPALLQPAFFDYLAALDAGAVRIEAIAEGSVVFPRVPLMRVEGPLLVCQLLETVFLTLVNFASLVATNAARHRAVAGPDKTLLEFGLRRAQGPDGGISASRYAFLGGFDATRYTFEPCASWCPCLSLPC